MSSAGSVQRVEAIACIMIHGVVTPVKIDHTASSGHTGCSYFKDQPCHEYTLSESVLPKNVNLYAPSILGYQYYDTNRTDSVIRDNIMRYKNKHQSAKSYKDFLLNLFKKYEHHNVKRLQDKINQEYGFGVSHGSDRTGRVDTLEVVTLRKQVVWNQHSHYIEEKRYVIYPDPTLTSSNPTGKKPFPSCIIIFYNNLRRDFDVDRDINSMFNSHHATYSSSYNGIPFSVKYNVRYDDPSSTFTIDFGDTDLGENSMSFEDIKDIILFLLIGVSPFGTRLSDIVLSIFDLTCSELDFPDITESGVEPVLLSSIDSESDSRLVYGTIPRDRLLSIKQQQASLWPSIKKTPDFYQSYVGSPSPGHSSSPARSSSSQPAGPSDICVVYLPDEVKSFVNFKLFQESASSVSPSPPTHSQPSSMAFGYSSSSESSVYSTKSSGSSDYGGPGLLLLSPSESIPRSGAGGSHRSHSRHRRTKKVTRNNGRNSNRRRKKVRSKTKRRNTKLR
jgi:hypothetical protein